MTFPFPHAARWWLTEPALRRVVVDLLGAELASMRPGSRPLPSPWPHAFDLRADLGADSLDMMGLAAALDSMLHLNRTVDSDAGRPGLLADTSLAHWLAAARAGLDAGGSALTFRTSGSSGAPKPCTHALATLWQESEALAALFPGRRRIVSLVPSHHIYGFLFTVLLPAQLGLEADVLDLRTLAPGEVARQVRPGDLVVGFPDFWRALAQAGVPPIAADVVGVTSTAPCPDEVARNVLEAGLVRLVQVYGSSETAGVGWRDSAQAPYRLFPYWNRTGDGQRLQRSMPDGTRMEATLQDRLDWGAAVGAVGVSDAADAGVNTFRPAGRVDQAVQVGGVNVFPAYVADVLKLHPAVAEASVRLMRADEGHRLKAFVVPRTGAVEEAAAHDAQAADALRATLQAWIGDRLSAPECPAAISFGPGLPRGASGKLADWIIDAWA